MTCFLLVMNIYYARYFPVGWSEHLDVSFFIFLIFSLLLVIVVFVKTLLVAKDGVLGFFPQVIKNLVERFTSVAVMIAIFVFSLLRVGVIVLVSFGNPHAGKVFLAITARAQAIEMVFRIARADHVPSMGVQLLGITRSRYYQEGSQESSGTEHHGSYLVVALSLLCERRL
jgi:Na+/proline symporter